MLTIGIDWDDVLCDLNARAIELANKEHEFNPPLALEEIDTWENTGRASVIKKYYKEQRLYDAQYVTGEAKKFMSMLCKQADVYICTAVAPDFMGTRVKQIKNAFPDFPEENIIMGFRKSLVKFDVSLDDGAHNILESKSKYPVLFRKPWNHKITGVLAVNTYDDFLQLLEQIKRSMIEGNVSLESPAVIALVGPSGSHKTQLLYNLIDNEKFKKPVSYSTNVLCSSSHKFLPEDAFDKKEMLETTMYAGYAYGTKKKDVEEILNSGSYAVLPLDICGAITMKRYYRTIIVYCKCNKETIIENILSKNITNEEKKLRLLTLEKEMFNERLADLVMNTEEENYSEILMNRLKSI